MESLAKVYPDVALEGPAGPMYVYLNSGAVDAVASVSGMKLTNDTLTLDCGDSTVEYPQSSIYLISRQLIAPPSLF